MEIITLNEIKEFYFQCLKELSKNMELFKDRNNIEQILDEFISTDQARLEIVKHESETSSNYGFPAAENILLSLKVFGYFDDVKLPNFFPEHMHPRSIVIPENKKADEAKAEVFYHTTALVLMSYFSSNFADKWEFIDSVYNDRKTHRERVTGLTDILLKEDKNTQLELRFNSHISENMENLYWAKFFTSLSTGFAFIGAVLDNPNILPLAAAPYAAYSIYMNMILQDIKEGLKYKKFDIPNKF